MSKSRTELAAVWPPTAAIAREAGHGDHILPLQAIRAKCLDCSCYQQSEVRLCEAVRCPLWPFRAGRYPVGRRELKNPEPYPDFERGEAFHEGSAAGPAANGGEANQQFQARTSARVFAGHPGTEVY